MRSFFQSLGVTGVVAACLVSGSAFAYATGQTGYSGKQGQSCMASGCHSGGSSTPTVTIEGPATLATGQSGTYTLVIKGGPGTRAGFNVAVDGNGGSLTAGSGSKKLSEELTHTAPKAFSNGEARFDFTLVAPANATSLTLFGSGNSVNGNGAETGDASAEAKLVVKVGGGDSGGGDDGGGCAAAAGAPLLGAVLMLLGVRARRRDA
ncbi:hypothetical protein LZ198_17440 [Myxococcus sp. K15C18031901]|uniref:MXAN_6652 family MXYO-CTERM-anchored protein n=1 Tax=Myxococcus dinghuensis TaxID=2906761 RepID=UPI0020A7BF59|nr:MXAN_6652 family MXYO-CTERM-anchored protein [Myxococcus dinghuensis]MCP3100656.1 hypothetical protein [Myxococcus dinghuensis]